MRTQALLADGFAPDDNASRRELLCSLARSVSFEAVAVADGSVRDRGGPEFGVLGDLLRGELQHGDVSRLGYTLEQELAMPVEPGVPPAALRLGCRAAAFQGRPALTKRAIWRRRSRLFTPGREPDVLEIVAVASLARSTMNLLKRSHPHLTDA